MIQVVAWLVSLPVRRLVNRFTLKALDPLFCIVVLKTLDDAGEESSRAWNNGGTADAANCELTPECLDDTIDISEAFEMEIDLSRHSSSYLVKKSAIADPQSFIHSVPHMSLMHGPESVALLKQRFSDVVATVDGIGKRHKWRVINDQPWRRAYVVLKPGAKDSFIPKRG